MSKLSLVLLSVLAVTSVAAKNAQVFCPKNINDGSGNFAYTSELSDGKIVSATGALKDDGSQFVSGAHSYSFVTPDGETHWVTYTADDEGFHPIIGAGPGDIGAGQDAEINPNLVKSLTG